MDGWEKGMKGAWEEAKDRDQEDDRHVINGSFNNIRLLVTYIKFGKWNFTSVLDLKCLFLHLPGISLVDAPCQATSSSLGTAPSQLNSKFGLLCLSS